MLVDNIRDFWSEVKRIRSNKTCPSNMVDDFTSPCDIANFFASKYQDLYTSVEFDKAEMDVVRGWIIGVRQLFYSWMYCMFLINLEGNW